MDIKTYSLKKSRFLGAGMVPDEKGEWANKSETEKAIANTVMHLVQREASLMTAIELAATVPQLTADLKEEKKQVEALNDLLEAKNKRTGELSQVIKNLGKELDAKAVVIVGLNTAKAIQDNLLKKVVTDKERALNLLEGQSEDYNALLEKVKMVQKEREEKGLNVLALEAHQLIQENLLQRSEDKEKELRESLMSAQSQIATQQDRLDLLEASKDVAAMADLADKVSKENQELIAEDQVKTNQMLEMQALLGQCQELLVASDKKEEGFHAAMEEQKETAARILSQIPNLKPIEAITNNAALDKTVVEVWGKAIWDQISPEIQAEVLFLYAQALTDPEVVRQQMEMMEAMSHPLQEHIASDSTTEQPAQTVLPQDRSGMNTPNLEQQPGQESPKADKSN